MTIFKNQFNLFSVDKLYFFKKNGPKIPRITLPVVRYDLQIKIYNESMPYSMYNMIIG